MSSQYDLIVIGSGPGGYVAAIRAAQLGMTVAIVEKAELGGVCLNWGCIPTKALLKSAQVFEYINHAADFGISVKESTVDFKGMVKRSREVANSNSKGIDFLFKKNKIDVIKGHGTLSRGKQVKVIDADGNKVSYEAKNIILATGGRARELPNLSMDGNKVIGYREAMTLSVQPKKMVIVGSGAIGVEFAYFYNSIGTEVTIVEYLQNILPVEDEDISATLARSFKKKGIKIMTQAEVTKVDKKGKGCKVSVSTKKGEEILECDIVLSAVGLATNLEDLGIENQGIVTEKEKVVVDEYYSTNISGIYAIGDIVQGQTLAHVASAEGIICVEKMAGQSPQPLDYGNIPGCTYCYPEISSVGMTEKEALAKGYEIKVGKFPFSASGKAKASGATEGFVKVIFDAKYGEWLGAHMIGANVTEMIGEAVVARKLETTGHEIIKSVHPHPTMSEAIMEAAADAYGEVIHM